MKQRRRTRRSRTLARPFLLLLLAGSLFLAVFIVRSFLTPIVFAILLAMLAAPVYEWIRERLGGRRSLAALIVLILTSGVIVVPVFGFLFLLFTQGAELLRQFAETLQETEIRSLLTIPALEELEALLLRFFPEGRLAGLDPAQRLTDLARQAVGYLVTGGVTVFGDIADIVSKFFIFLFLFFYLVRDGSSMVAELESLLPMRGSQTARIFERVRDVTRAVVFGTLAVAVLQGALGGIGFAIVGIPGLLWGTVMGISSLIPVVGTGLVSVPTVIYLVFTQQYWQAIFFGLWAIVLVGGVDNYARPFLMQGRTRMSPFFIFLAVIGGLATFGLPGLVFGPLAIALAVVMVQIYRDEFRGQLRPL